MSARRELPVPARLGGFLALLLAVFASAFGLGACSGGDHGGGGGHGGHGAHGGARAAAMGGLAAEQDGYRLTGLPASVPSGTEATLSFRVERDGRAVTSFTPNHERDLHLILARTDLARELHVHPTRGADGTWSIPVTFDTPGAWRAIADFVPSGAEGPVALGAPLTVTGPGDAAPAAQPPPGGEADGYSVRFTGTPRAGAEARLAFVVSRDGAPVTDLRRHLGALAHLVVLRKADLGYLHVHPEDGAGTTFAATFPTAGAYRLFLEFDHGSGLHTVSFDVDVPA